jgi:acetylornithine deacetylase/succinyl-diaminopimelate desuccinylase-like protein
VSSRHERLALLDRYLRIPTISRQVTPALVDDVRAFWRDLGLDLTVLPVPDGTGTPALWGEVPGPPGAPTLLLYGHYDVQPTGDLERWRWENVACRPFEPAYFHEGRPVDPRTLDERALGEVTVVARGGADNKGQHLANVLGALDAARAGRAQWRVRIVLDGEEEHGSPNLDAIARAHRERLTADVLIGSDGPKQKNAPTLVMGVRGLVGVELVADNGRPASLHSGNYGNIVPNPVLPLARLIEDIETRVRAFGERHDAFRREATELFAKWEGRAVWKPFLHPTVNVNAFLSDGASLTARRTIIPRTAHARLDIRVTPDTPPAAMEEIVTRTLAEHRDRTPGVAFTARFASQPASYTSPARPEFGWLLRLLEQHGGAEPVALPTLGGTLPLWVFTETLGIPALWIPAANSDNQQHDVNEHFVLRHFFQQIALYADVVGSRPV